MINIIIIIALLSPHVISVDPSEPSAALHAWVEFLRDMHGPEEQAGVDAMERDLWGMFLELEAALVSIIILWITSLFIFTCMEWDSITSPSAHSCHLTSHATTTWILL